ncbi:MAG: type I-C CRISPR-associated endonuclease Cas1 [Nitrospiraceae bacterium]|nr:type I-C CRISPR-associated endonuclease Cas1 [Nitrospiraceae bacterium]
MKRLLNTLYVTTQGAYVSRNGETVLIRHEEKTKLRVPIHTLGGLVCFGQVMCSPPLLGLCAERGVTVSFLSEYGRFLARVHGPVSGNVLLRREQYRRADDLDASAELARAFVVAKIANTRTILLRSARERPEDDNTRALSDAAARMARVLNDLRQFVPLDTVRGREGDAARAYFSVFDHLITANKDHFFFHGRNRRPPLDSVNALLSFIYTLLRHDCDAALESVGLDPAVGYLHRDRPGRPGLALDLMEELRPPLADRLVLTLLNRQQLKPRGFKKTETGAVHMDDDTRKEVLIAYQKRKQDEIQHPFLQEKIAIGLLPHVQAQLLARYLRGDLEAYPPFLWK